LHSHEAVTLINVVVDKDTDDNGRTTIRRRVSTVENTAMALSGSATQRVRTVLDPVHWEDADPFLLLNEDWFATGTFADHPHRGMETFGGSGALNPRDAQWITAGRGVIHIKDAHPEKPLNTLQAPREDT
jgi:quercetin 2,3-dioxygenase